MRAGAAGFCPAASPACARAAVADRRPQQDACGGLRMGMKTGRKWETQKTLADKLGSSTTDGAATVGLSGSVPVCFTQGNATVETMAFAGQPLSQVATQAGQFIRYKCMKGECGTCEVKVDGKWIRTCSTKVPQLAQGETFTVHVRESMVKTKKSSRFFSVRSFFAGFKNNLLGMVGFARTGLGRQESDNFKQRLETEAKILELAKAKKAARAAAKK